MFEIVINVNLAAYSLCSYNIVALRHMPCLVDFPRVINLYIKGKLLLLLLWRRGLILFASILSRHLDWHDLELVRFAIRLISHQIVVADMRSNEYFLWAVLFTIELSSVNPRWHPLDSEWGPSESVREKSFIEERSVFLEDLLLLRLWQVFILLIL